MRDPKRIDRILNGIREIWEENPDLRLFQILCNLRLIHPGFCHDEHGERYYVGAFYEIEDCEVEEALDKRVR